MSTHTAAPSYTAVIIGLSAIGAQRPTLDHTSTYGRVSQSHASCFQAHPQTKLVAVCDLRADLLDAFRSMWQDVWPELQYFTDYRAMLQQLKPDIVSVVTPDHRHADITVEAATGGAKAILCEKPLATTLADANRMIAACQQHGTLLSVEHTRRWYPIYHQARALLHSGELGALRNLSCRFSSKRAMLFRNGAHMIDMLRFLADSEVQWVWSELEAGYDHYDIYRGDGGHASASEPSAIGYLHFTNGVRAVYESVKSHFSDMQFSATCDNGRIDLNDDEMTVTRPDDNGGWARTTTQFQPDNNMMLMGAVNELVQAIEQNGELLSPGHSGRATLEVLLAFLQSHTRGNVRVDLPLL